MCEKWEPDNSFWEHIQKNYFFFLMGFFFIFFLFLSSVILICFVSLNATCCYHAQQGISDDERGEHSLIATAANHISQSVATVNGALLCSCISVTWLHSV